MSAPRQTDMKNIKWQSPTNFKISFSGPGADFIQLTGKDDLLTLACKGIQMAEHNASGTDGQWIAEQWVFNIGRLEAPLITLNFKDYDNFTLYKSFSNAIQKFTRMYPNAQKMDIAIYTTDTFDIENYKLALTFKDCIMQSVSGPELDHTAVASIAEFSVTWRCTYVELPNPNIIDSLGQAAQGFVSGLI